MSVVHPVLFEFLLFHILLQWFFILLDSNGILKGCVTFCYMDVAEGAVRYEQQKGGQRWKPVSFPGSFTLTLCLKRKVRQSREITKADASTGKELGPFTWSLD